VAANQLRLVIEGIALAGPAEHEELDDRFGSSRMMRARLVGADVLIVQDARQRHGAEAAAKLLQKFSA
jgi:hypothetical protein